MSVQQGLPKIVWVRENWSVQDVQYIQTHYSNNTLFFYKLAQIRMAAWNVFICTFWKIQLCYSTDNYYYSLFVKSDEPLHVINTFS